jgi:hypothetical protein
MSERFNETETDQKNVDDEPGDESDDETEISTSRDNILATVKSSSYPKEGFIVIGGEYYGTIKAWADYFGIPQSRIIEKIKEERKKLLGQPQGESAHFPSALIEKYYPERIFKDLIIKKTEEANGLPVANEHGYFIRDGKMAGTMDFWVKHCNLDKNTFKNQMEKDKIPSMEGKTHDLQDETFYFERHIQVVVSRWRDSQRKLLEELYSSHKLPRMRIKKDSTLHSALKGDVILAIPKEYTGIYQLLQNEFNLKPPKSGEVYVLFDKRGGVSVVFKSELEENKVK